MTVIILTIININYNNNITNNKNNFNNKEVKLSFRTK